MAKKNYEQMAKDAEKNGNAQEITVNFIKLKDKGQRIVGKLIGITPTIGKNSNRRYFQYIVDTDAGLAKASFGSAYDAEMAANISIGGVYSWTFEGQEELPNGNRINRIITKLIDDTDFEQSVAEYVLANYGAEK